MLWVFVACEVHLCSSEVCYHTKLVIKSSLIDRSCPHRHVMQMWFLSSSSPGFSQFGSIPAHIAAPPWAALCCWTDAWSWSHRVIAAQMCRNTRQKLCFITLIYFIIFYNILDIFLYAYLYLFSNMIKLSTTLKVRLSCWDQLVLGM